MQPKLLCLGAHRFVGDLRHVDAPGFMVNSPHAFFFEREFFRIACQENGL
jgi:hypothetical protein